MRAHVDEGVLVAASRSPDPGEAADEIHASLSRIPLGLILFFCSPAYDLDRLAVALKERFRGIAVVGCTSAGEITPAGYEDGTIAAIGFAASDFITALARIARLSDGRMSDAAEVATRLRADLVAAGGFEEPNATFGFVMFDGATRREEAVMSALGDALSGIPLFGGSAGDDLYFENARVFVDGAFHADSAVLVLFATPHPFKVFTTQHFVRTDKKMVVTEADPVRRAVMELNAEPAVVEYARLVGIPVDELSPMTYAAHPVVVRIGGTDYVRSIQRVNDDGSFTFYCAIDEGIILALAEGGDLVSQLQEVFAGLRAEVGEPQVIIGCDCVLRRLECEQKQSKCEVSRLMRENKVIGFNSYGEQFASMHINQTLTGVAIGRRGGTR